MLLGHDFGSRMMSFIDHGRGDVLMDDCLDLGTHCFELIIALVLFLFDAVHNYY